MSTKKTSQTVRVTVNAGALNSIADQLRGLADTIEGLLATDVPPDPHALTIKEAAERLQCSTKLVAKLIQHHILDNSPGMMLGRVMVTTRSVEHAKTLPLDRLPARAPRTRWRDRYPWRPIAPHEIEG